MKYCTKCGAVHADNVQFCTECGAALGEPVHTESTNNQPNKSGTEQSVFGTPYNPPSGYNNTMNYGRPSSSITPRSIPLCIVFSIITCGIYSIYWMIQMNDEVNHLAGEPEATSGVMVFLLSLITCSIYSFYWIFKMGERCDRIKGRGDNSNLLFLILSLVGLSIVSYCLVQDTINKAVS